MRAARIGFSAGRVEAGIAMLSFGASSVYWLGLAFAMSPDAYGRMMTIQAAVLVVVTILTFRTHDLFFNLVTQNRCPVGEAYRKTMRIELAAASAGALLCAAGALMVLAPGEDWSAAAQVALYAVLASFGAINGASIGKLRYWTRGDIIAKTDMLAALAWAAACLSIPFGHRVSIVIPLIVGAAPNVVRAISLILSARALALKMEPDSSAETAADELDRRQILGFLAGAQVTNFLKNAAVPIETLILAVFATPATVAMYRVARATQGAATAALNVLYQRVYPALARATSTDERNLVLHRLRRNSLATCFLIFPLSALIALGYSLLKPEIGIVELQLITAGTFLALLPSAYQQGAFAVLSIAGDHRSAGMGYICSFLFLGLTSLLLLVWPRVEIFMVGVIGGAFVRVWYLNRQSHRTIQLLPGGNAGAGR